MLVDIVLNRDPTLRITSLELAQILDKAHKVVVRDIQAMLKQLADFPASPELGRQPWICEPKLHVTERGQCIPVYVLDYIAAACLITGYKEFRQAVFARVTSKGAVA